MGVHTTVTEYYGAPGMAKEPIDDRVVSLGNAIELFHKLTYGPDRRYPATVRHIGEDRVEVYFTQYIGPEPENNPNNMPRQVFGFVYKFEEDPEDQDKTFECFIQTAAGIGRVRPEVCEEPVRRAIGARVHV